MWGVPPHKYLDSFLTNIHSNKTRNNQLKVLLHSSNLGHSRTPSYCREMFVNVHKLYLSIIELEMVHNRYWLIIGGLRYAFYIPASNW